MKKHLRIQEASGRGKKGKPKVPITVVWDGIQDPIALVKKRIKAAASLRDMDTKKEYSRQELIALNDKIIILASSDPTEWVPLPSPESNDSDMLSKKTFTNKALPSELPNGLKLSKHARERMHKREISPQEVEECYEKGRSVSMPQKQDNDGINIVVSDKEPLLITTYGNITETLPFDPHQALVFVKNGLLREIRQHLSIRIHYEDDIQAFVMHGDQKAIQLAKRRIGNLNTKIGATILRIPSPKNTVGKVIGTKGTTINRIRNTCGIPYNINVAWESETQHLVLTILSLLDEQSKANLFLMVDDLVNDRDPNLSHVVTSPKISPRQEEVEERDNTKGERKQGSRSSKKTMAIRKNHT